MLLYTGLILITPSAEEKRDIKLRKNIGGKEVKEYNFECIFKSKPISPVFRLNIYIYICSSPETERERAERGSYLRREGRGGFTFLKLNWKYCS